ncbi:MAG: flagellar export chaperone FliS, partial [Limnobacter sp.]|nr:flagellar export chaperone FliS [Limnobacter sp.]
QSVDLQSSVMSASPHALITMLLDEAIKRMRLASLHMEDRRFAEKGACIGKSIQIIQEGLLAALDKEKGGQIAEQLEALYEYVTKNLVLASAKNDTALLEVCIDIMSEVRAGWVEMGEHIHSNAAAGNPAGG